jgi:dihydrodipicolinate synthase/N-acetylneuraminate lyase
MIQIQKHHGVVVPVVTPATAGGDIDEKAAHRIIGHCAENNLGVFVLGTTGEASSISATKRIQLVKVAIAQAQGRVPVFAGIGDNCPENSIAAGNEYLRLGADAVVAHVPSYYPLRPSEMKSYFELLAREIRGALMLYNIPQTTHLSVPLEVVESVSHHETIIGFKDSENAPGRMEETARRFGGRPDFSIFMGVALLSAKALKLGFDGLVPSSGNIVPALWRELYESARRGQWEAVEKLQSRLDSIGQVFQRERLLGESLAAIKAAMAGQGICEPHMLPPLRALEKVDGQSVHRAFLDLKPI